MNEGLTLHPSRGRIASQDELKQLVEVEGKAFYAPGKKRDDDFDKLVRMGEDNIELVLSNVKTFSEALVLLGVGRKAFMDWLEREPSRKDWMGRTPARPIWER